MFEQITALHQQVREYVEQLEPEYKVTDIDGYTTTKYLVPFDQRWDINPENVKPENVEYVHVFTDMRFKVSAEHVPYSYRKLRVDVRVTSDGKLFAGDRLMSI